MWRLAPPAFFGDSHVGRGCSNPGSGLPGPCKTTQAVPRRRSTL